MKALCKLLIVCLAVLCVPLVAHAQTHTVTLNWTAPPPQTGVTISGYNVYQSTTSGSGYTKLNSTPVSPTNFTTLPLSGGTPGGPGVMYFFVVRSVRPPCTTCSPAETSPVESANSNEASALVPAPPPPPPPVPNPPTGVTTTVNP